MPPHLDLVPDAVFKPEPLMKSSKRPYHVFGATYKPIPGNALYSQRVLEERMADAVPR